MRLIYCLILFTLFHKDLPGQQDITSGNSSIQFAKLEFFSRSTIRESKFGRSSYAYNKTYFIDRGLRLNNQRYEPIGLFYRRLEKYCKLNGIYYNRHELAVYRRQAVLAGSLFGMAGMGFIPVYFNSLHYSNKTGYNQWPEVLFKGKLSPVLWLLPVAEGIIACKLKGRAERKLRNRLFLNDAYEK